MIRNHGFYTITGRRGFRARLEDEFGELAGYDTRLRKEVFTANIVAPSEEVAVTHFLAKYKTSSDLPLEVLKVESSKIDAFIWEPTW